jgi:membrane protease YdiL (CAAX protease family)
MGRYRRGTWRREMNPLQNPLRWKREHQIAWAIVCAFGAVAGLLLGFIHSPFFLTSQPSQGFAVWLSSPQSYWPWPLFGVLISELIFYAAQLLRKEN